MQIKILLPTTKQFQEKSPVTPKKPPFFGLLFIGALAEKKQDIPYHKSMLFHPVLKTYPTPTHG